MVTQVVEFWEIPNGSIWNIGQFTKQQERDFEKKVKRGTLLKFRSRWQGISPLKTVYILNEED